jgi:hypothetical protein
MGKAAIQVGAGTSASPTTDINIYGCVISNYVTWGIQLVCNANNSVLNGVTIDGLVMHDDYQYSPVTWLGCAGAYPHHDGVFCYVGNSPLSTNCSLGTMAAPVIIRNSCFYNNMEPSTNNGGTARIYLSNWGGVVEIYNNVFANVLDKGNGSIALGASLPPSNGSSTAQYYIFNNTFYDGNRGMVGSGNMSNSLVVAENNIFYNAATTGGGLPFGLDTTSFVNSTNLVDHNLYYTGRPGQEIAVIGTSYLPLSRFATNGFEGHGKYGNPNFTNISYGLGPNSSLNDFHLTASSPAIAAGTNLSWMFTTDREGRSRPATGNWDLGAYQYSTPSPPLAAPTNLRVVAP